MREFTTPEESSKWRRIAVIRLSAMGDCILLQPTLIRILDHFPQLEIDWYIDTLWVSLFKPIPRLNLIPIRKPKTMQDYLSLKRQHFDQKYDVLLAMQASFRANLLYSFIKAPLKIGFDWQRSRDGQWLWTNRRIAAGQDHLCDGFARFADALGVPAVPKCWQLEQASLPELSQTRLPVMVFEVLQQRRPVIAIVAAASKLERTPEAEFWRDCIQHLDKDLSSGQIFKPILLLLGGPAALEKELSLEITTDLATSLEVYNLVGQTSLRELAGLLAHATCLISPDSGPVHLANALGTPVVGLYAVAPSKLSGPYDFQHLTFDKYNEAVQTFLKVDPTTVAWGTRVHDRKAMSLIAADLVARRVADLVRKGET